MIKKIHPHTHTHTKWKSQVTKRILIASNLCDAIHVQQIVECQCVNSWRAKVKLTKINMNFRAVVLFHLLLANYHSSFSHQYLWIASFCYFLIIALRFSLSFSHPLFFSLSHFRCNFFIFSHSDFPYIFTVIASTIKRFQAKAFFLSISVCMRVCLCQRECFFFWVSLQFAVFRSLIISFNNRWVTNHMITNRIIKPNHNFSRFAMLWHDIYLDRYIYICV